MPTHPRFPVVESNSSGCTTYKQDPPKIQMSSLSASNLSVNYLGVCHMETYKMIVLSHEYRITVFFNNFDNMNDFQYNKIYPNNPGNINSVSYTHLTLPTIYSV